MYFEIVDNIQSKRHKKFNNKSNFLTTTSLFNPTSKKCLINYFIFKCKNYYEDDEYISNKLVSQSLTKNM